MGTTLTGKIVSETYDSLLKVTDNNTITGTKKRITDGFGNDTPLLLSSTDVQIDGAFLLPGTTLQYVRGDGSLATFSGGLTSVGLTIGSTGTDANVSGSPLTANGAITLNLPSASATNRGLLSSADWSTFNSKESVLTFSSPLSRSVNTISIPVATTSVNGYLTSTDWNTFNSKQGAITLTTSGSSGASTLIGSTLNIPTYTLTGLGGVPTSRTLTINGTTFDLSANRSWTIADTGLTSVGVSMPSAFSVSGSPLTANGTITITGAGNGLQYIDGTGALQTFPVFASADKLITEVYNKSGATLTKGTIIYISGTQGNLPSVDKALATTDQYSAQTFGFVQANISNMSNGYVIQVGRLTDLDTSAYTDGTQLYLSPSVAGTYTSTKPYAPPHLVYVGIVVRAHPTQGSIEVKIQNGYELEELHNVSAQSPNNNDGIFYNTTTTLWEKKSIATALGFTPVTNARAISTTAPLSGGGDLSADRTLTISQATTSTNGYLSSTDWNTFNGKESALTFSSPLSRTTNTISIPVATSLANGYLSSTDWSTFNGKLSSAVTTLNTLTASTQTFAVGTSGTDFAISSATSTHTFNLPTASATNRGALSSADWTIFNGKGSGSVTSVSALTLGTTGTDLSSSVATGTTTPVITLNVPTASASNRGALSSTDWSTFNGKESALTFSAPLSRSVNTISMPVATTSVNGYLSSTDWTTFNGKQATITGGATSIVSSNLTIGRALISDGVGKVAVATTTSTEIGYVNGVTSAIQTQLDAKAPLASPTLTGTPLSTTAAFGTNTTQIATTAFVQQELINSFNRQTASYTLVLADRNKVVETNVATANNLTIPLNSSVAFAIGTEIQVLQYGAGQTTIVATSGVTTRSKSGQLKIGNQYTGVTLKKVGTDEWYVIGNVSA